MQAKGFRAIVNSQELRVMGFAEILGRLPKIFKIMSRVEAEALRSKPDAIVMIDYPGFHFRLAKRLKDSGIPIVYYIPPKVWVWKKFRMKAMPALFAKVLCIFPFEERIFAEANVPARFVGNPLVDSLPLSLSKSDARKNLSIDESETVVTLMPGSRPAELSAHFEIMVKAAFDTATKLGRNLRVLVPVSVASEKEKLEKKLVALVQKSAGLADRLKIYFVISGASTALRASDAGLIKSGTSTLEAALMGCPHAVVYRVSWLTEMIFKFIVRYKGPVGLVNLMLGSFEEPERVTREILGHTVGAADLALELESLLVDSAKTARMQSDFDRIRERVVGDAKESPSDRVAKEVLGVVAASKLAESGTR